IARISVAESAEVMKNMSTNTIEAIDNQNENGNCSNIWKFRISIACCVRSVPLCCTLVAVVPIVANQIEQITVGTTNTPRINSRIVLFRDTRAINIPTNGAHEIHHAQ